MNKSLQDQLLGAGLIDKKKAKKISKENRKAQNEKNRSKEQVFSDAKAAALQAKKEKQEKDAALNQQKNHEAEKKSIAAQVSQLIDHYKLDRQGGDQEYNFSDGKKIKKMLVPIKISEEIIRGRLCIAKQGETYEIIPKPIAEKIRGQDEASIIVFNEKSTDAKDTHDTHVESDDDYYAQFEIPDDLMW